MYKHSRLLGTFIHYELKSFRTLDVSEEDYYCGNRKLKRKFFLMTEREKRLEKQSQLFAHLPQMSLIGLKPLNQKNF
jgi:hypothetical protein